MIEIIILMKKISMAKHLWHRKLLKDTVIHPKKFTIFQDAMIKLWKKLYAGKLEISEAAISE